MNKWAFIRALLLCLVALVLSSRDARADINCCDLCANELDNFHDCDGCTITTLGSCQWNNVAADSCTCYLPNCDCGGGGDPDCEWGGCNGGLCPENCE